MPVQSKTAIIIPSFKGSDRLGRLLDSLVKYDHDAFVENTFHIFEDPSDDESTRRYHQLLDQRRNVTFTKLDMWSNLQGAAIKAVASLDRGTYEWFLYLGDDLLITPYALSSVLHFIESNTLESVSLVQIPYWNAHDLTPGGYNGKGYSDMPLNGHPFPLKTKQEMYSLPVEWLLNVPRNRYWDGNGMSRPHINVNGAGFACKLKTYDQVGGFADKTWCIDETISVRTWLESNQAVVTLPGPPFVHYFAGASLSNPPFHHCDLEEAWVASMGMTKSVADKLCREKMEERSERVMAEMASASYYNHASKERKTA